MRLFVTALPPCRLCCLLLLLGLGWLPLRAQPRQAKLENRQADQPSLVPVPLAVARALQHYFPAVAADTATTWWAEQLGWGHDPDSLHFHVNFMRTRPDTLVAEPFAYYGTIEFAAGGQVHRYIYEAALDTLPKPVRRTVRQMNRRLRPQHFYAAVADATPLAGRPSHRAIYAVYFTTDTEPGKVIGAAMRLRRNGRLIRERQPHFR